MVQGEGRGRNEPGPTVLSPAPQGSSTESAAFSGNRRADRSLPKGKDRRAGLIGWLISIFNPLPLPSNSRAPQKWVPSPFSTGPIPLPIWPLAYPSLPLWLAA